MMQNFETGLKYEKDRELWDMEATRRGYTGILKTNKEHKKNLLTPAFIK